MFSVIQRQEEGFQKVILQNESNRIEIIPACGGIVNAWYVELNSKRINLIEGYESAEDFRNHCESKGFRGCKLSPYVCRIRNGQYNFNDTSFDIGKFGFDENKIHGLMYDAPFEVVHQQSDDLMAMVQVETCYPGTDPGYPFQYTIMIEYILQQNQLTLNTLVLNQAEDIIPLADGWHPYFTLGSTINDCTFQMASDTMLEFDEKLIPTGEVLAYEKFRQAEKIGEAFLDNSFLLQRPLFGPACVFANPAQNIQLEITPDASYPILQVYTPESRSSIALENLSAAPDAFNNRIGLLYVEPNETRTFSTTYKISSTK